LRWFHWAFALAGLVMGVLLAYQFRITREIQSMEPVVKAQQLTAQIIALKKERDFWRARVDELRTRLDKTATGTQVEDLKAELEKARIEAGFTELTGPGVEVTLNDSGISLRPGENPNLYVLHDEDVLKVLNEIKAAGAEAVSINGERLLATTEVRCTGPTVVLNKNKRLAPPYVITAIGNPDTLESSLRMKGGVAETLQFWGIQVNVKKLPQVTVPAYTGGIRFEYAKPAG